MNEIKVYYKESGELVLRRSDLESEITIKECYPQAHPGKYLSFRDSSEREVLFLDATDELDKHSRECVHSYLGDLSFLHQILQVEKIEEDVEFRNFHLVTNAGQRVVQTPLEEWPQRLEDDSILIQDLSGDLFQIRSYQQLGPSDRKKLAPYVE